jgi:20S proteasome subunit beta 4
MVKQPYVVQGYAAFYAMALLDHHYRTNLSEEEGVELAKMCLKEINLRMPASVGDVDIVILSNDKPPKQFIIADKDLRKTI